MRVLSVLVFIAGIFVGTLLAEPSTLVIRQGYLTSAPMQHPRITDHDDYFDVTENGKTVRQIIVVFDSKLSKPMDRSRRLELKGSLKKINLGGSKHTRKSYKNEILYVSDWIYL